jgi:methylmalonyl-CoA/ethylmalonyl-CoA epimerase
MKIDHVGIAVKDIHKATNEYEITGFKKCGSIIKDTDRNVLIQFMKNQETKIELIARDDVSSPSPVDNLLKGEESAMYHFCYKVDNIQNEIGKLRRLGRYLILIPPKPAIAFGNRKVAFLFCKYAGIIELVEKR